MMSRLKELYYWIKARVLQDNSYFEDIEHLRHENNELLTNITLLDEENTKLRKELHKINQQLVSIWYEDFCQALYDFLQQQQQSDTSDMLTNELRLKGEVEVQIAGREVNRKKIKQAFGNFERYLTIDIQERGLYYSLIFKRR